MKKILWIGLLAIFCAAASAPTAWAGAKQRHRWEGVAIGVGAAILGHAIIQQHHRAYAHPYRGGGTVIIERNNDRCDYPRRRYRRHHRARPARGHWENRRMWVSPVYEKVWNPGHYDVDQRWVPGQWIEVVKEPGYWVEKREWIGWP